MTPATWAAALLADDSTMRFRMSMSAEQLRHLERAERVVTLLPAGSRYVCPDHAREDSDWDWYCRATTDDFTSLFNLGWICGGSFHQSCSMKQENINLILFETDWGYTTFHAATLCAKVLRGPTDKPQRVAMYEAFKRMTSAELAAQVLVLADKAEDDGDSICEEMRRVGYSLLANQEENANVG